MSKLIGVARESVRGGFYLFLGNFLSTLISAIAIIVIARLLGPSDYGLYNISLIIPSLLVLFTDLGVNMNSGGLDFNAFKTLVKYGFPLYLTSILAGFISQYRKLILT